jgi:hypothetical protein
VACVSGNLRFLRSQLEFLKGEVDRTLVLVDEGLSSIGLGEFNAVKQADAKAQPTYLSPFEGPTSKDKAHLSNKREKGPLAVKHVFHVKPTLKVGYESTCWGGLSFGFRPGCGRGLYQLGCGSRWFMLRPA